MKNYVLRRTGVDDRDIRIIKKVYWRKKAVVRVNGELTDECHIQRGVRQGCILSLQTYVMIFRTFNVF